MGQTFPSQSGRSWTGLSAASIASPSLLCLTPPLKEIHSKQKQTNSYLEKLAVFASNIFHNYFPITQKEVRPQNIMNAAENGGNGQSLVITSRQLNVYTRLVNLKGLQLKLVSGKTIQKCFDAITGFHWFLVKIEHPQNLTVFC